jgi:acyl-CoA synthetase (AMP-forming)/AMP-acid ligase II
MMTIGNIITRNAIQYPEKEALVFQGKGSTWTQLNQRINRLANAFLAKGFQKGDKVALLSENVPACVEANYALAKIGVVYFPVLSRLLPADIRYLVDLSDARALIYHESYAPMVSEIRGGMPNVETYIRIDSESESDDIDYEAFLATGGPEEPNVEVNPSDPYIFLCTGGTTGISKIAMLTHENAMWAIYTSINAFNITDDDTGIQVLPLFHVIINNCLNTLMAAGARVVLSPGFEAVQYMKDIYEQKVTVVMVVPPFLFSWIAALPEAMQYDMSHVRVFGTAAATFPADLKKQVQAHFSNADIYYVYGLTECSGGNATVLDRTQVFEKDGSIGVVNSILQYRIVDEFGEAVELGKPGELLLKGPSVISGYYKREEETRETFTDGWLHTGDIVSQDEEGFIYFVDRRKEMIKTGGENVFAKEVEDALLNHPKIQEVGVFGLEDEKWGEKIHAAIVLNPGETMEEEEAIAYAKENLPGFKCPKTVFFIPALPRNPSGKVLKYILKDEYTGEGK